MDALSQSLDEGPSPYTLLVSVGLILLALFVCLASAVPKDKTRTTAAVKSVSESIGFTVAPNAVPQAETEKLATRLHQIISNMHWQYESPDDTAALIRLPMSDLFVADRDDIRVEAAPLLKELATTLSGQRVHIALDNRLGEKVPTSMKLGIDRAGAFTRFFLDSGVTFSRLKVDAKFLGSDKIIVQIESKP